MSGFWLLLSYDFLITSCRPMLAKALLAAQLAV